MTIVCLAVPCLWALALAAKQGFGGKGRTPLLTAGFPCCALALTLTGCATPPVVKRDYLDQRRGGSRL